MPDDQHMHPFFRIAAIALITLSTHARGQNVTYTPDWESLDARPTPRWFDDGKFGIFIHWGVYAVPAWGPKERYSEWYWHDMMNRDGETWKFHLRTYGEKVKYQDFAPMFKAEMFDPDQWADLFRRSGAKYVVLTSKHHDGFCLWPSPQSWNWNAVDVGPHRDLVDELSAAVRKARLRMGFYYSLYEWFHPLYRSDPDRYVEQHMLPQLKDLVERYEPSLVWPDGEWEHPEELWRSREFLAWLFNESPVREEVAVNDRWGRETRGRHGGFHTTEYGHHHPGDVGPQHKWEECRGMGMSFGYNRNENVDDYKSASDLIHLLIETVSEGGNLLLNIGPTADGRIPVIMQQRLIEIGAWLDVNGEAIYATRPWRETAEGDSVRYTSGNGAVYAMHLGEPASELALSAPRTTPRTGVMLLGRDEPLDFRTEDGRLIITLPRVNVEEYPFRRAWTFKLTGVD